MSVKVHNTTRLQLEIKDRYFLNLNLQGSGYDGALKYLIPPGESITIPSSIFLKKMKDQMKHQEIHVNGKDPKMMEEKKLQQIHDPKMMEEKKLQQIHDPKMMEEKKLQQIHDPKMMEEKKLQQIHANGKDPKMMEEIHVTYQDAKLLVMHHGDFENNKEIFIEIGDDGDLRPNFVPRGQITIGQRIREWVSSA